LGADDLHLVVESINVNPAQAVCRIFGDARIDIYADGLMSYGPTRCALPGMVASRIERLLYLDLVPGVTPLLLSERRVPTVIIPDESFRAVAKIMIAENAVARSSEPVAMIVGQYLAAGELMSELQELDLYAEMISRCAEAGYSALVFKPHPSAPPTQLARLHHAAGAHGVRLAIADERELPEAWFECGGVDLVVGCFSTGLLTAATIYGLPVASRHRDDLGTADPLPEQQPDSGDSGKRTDT
jgi:Alpha-2,8-polysialyltransferase (POLYST)